MNSFNIYFRFVFVNYSWTSNENGKTFVFDIILSANQYIVSIL